MGHTAPTITDALTMARHLVASGVSVVPFVYGTKDLAYDRLPRVQSDAAARAKPSWSPFRERLPTDDELTAWFRDGPCNVAVVGGTISGGLVVLDVESITAYDTWCRFATALLDDTVIAALPVVRTGQGKHVYFRMPNPIGNRTLAKRRRSTPAPGMPRYELLAETRGEGGLALAPPSIHPSGTPYTLEQGDLGNIPLLTPAQAQAVLDAACAVAEEEQINQGMARVHRNGQPSVIEHFNQRHTVQTLLEH